jgi:heme oxygenase
MSDAPTTAVRERGAAPRHAALRAATRDAHARVDAFFPDGLRDTVAYRAYLRGMHRFSGDLAAAFTLAARRDDGGRSARLGADCVSACALLAADLVVLQAAPLPPRGSAPGLGDAANRLGWEYVFAGSAHGARLLMRHARALGYDGSRGARFLESHAAGAGWDDLLDRIERDGGDAEAQPLHDGARAAFAHAEACFLRARDEALRATGPESTP